MGLLGALCGLQGALKWKLATKAKTGKAGMVLLPVTGALRAHFGSPKGDP